jgi:hypothetical protein
MQKKNLGKIKTGRDEIKIMLLVRDVFLVLGRKSFIDVGKL